MPSASRPDDEVVEAFTGDTLEEAMAAAVAALGPDLVVRRARKVRSGLSGLIGRERYEVLALPDPSGPADPAAAVEDALAALLDRADAVEAGLDPEGPYPDAPRPAALRPVAVPPPAPLPPPPSPARRRPPTGVPAAARQHLSASAPHPGLEVADHQDAPPPSPSTPAPVAVGTAPASAAPGSPAPRSRAARVLRRGAEPAPEPGPAALDTEPVAERPHAQSDPSVPDHDDVPVAAEDRGGAQEPGSGSASLRRSVEAVPAAQRGEPARSAPARERRVARLPEPEPAEEPEAAPGARPRNRRVPARRSGWSTAALQRMGVPAEVLEHLDAPRPSDDLAWVGALARAIAAVVPDPAEPSEAHPVVLSGHGLTGTLAVLDAGVRGATPGTISYGGRTAPATATELALAVRHHLSGS